MKLLHVLMYSVIVLCAFPLSAADKETLLRELGQHEARSASTWSEYTGKDIKSRILPAPDIIIDYLRKDNQVQGYDERPRKPEIDPAFFSDIVGAVTDLPKAVKDHIEKHVVAIFLAEELGGTAYTELLRDFTHNKQGFIVLDIIALNRKANEWLTWKANSPFSPKGAYTIKAEIEQKRTDTKKSAIQYILLHEVGHLVGAATGAHPSWLTGGHPQEWPFTRLSWLTWEQGFDGKSKFDTTFTNRSNLKFYSFDDAPLTANEMDETFRQLLKTDFVSLYAATNMYDDFAETYAMYVHVILQNRKWEMRIIREGKTVRKIKNPILDKRCESKRKYLENMFK